MSSSDSPIMFIVNPNSKGGRTKKLWKKYETIIRDTINRPWEYRIADEMGKGMQVAEDAVKEGFTTLVGVGGEGTINEVVNGGFIHNPEIKIGFIRSGTANDFLSSHVYDWPKAIENQLKVIENGAYWMAPLTKVEADYTRYSLNLADTGISAMVSYESSVKRRLSWIKGGLRYYILALMNVYKWRNIPATIIIDNQEFEGDLTMLVAGFSKMLGAYHALPHAELMGDKMAYLLARDFSRVKIVRLMNRVKKGTHSNEIEGIDMGFASNIQVKAEIPPLFEVDGEPYSQSTSEINISAVPNAIRIITHDNFDPSVSTQNEQ